MYDTLVKPFKRQTDFVLTDKNTLSEIVSVTIHNYLFLNSKCSPENVMSSSYFYIVAVSTTY